MHTALNWIFHLDSQLAYLTTAHGAGVYLILFCVIFIETGVVVMPVLPGDSLIFIAGALAAEGILSPWILLAVLSAAAIAGDAANFAVGNLIRNNAAGSHRLLFLSQEHLARTRSFFKSYGSTTIILARFVPVVRTLAPFVAALSNMAYRRFIVYNAIGGIFWVASLLGIGYGLGTVPWVREHLSSLLLGMVALSIVPGLIGWMREKKAGK